MNSKILVVDDNLGDIALLQMALRRHPLPGGETVHYERDGKSALGYLHTTLSHHRLPVLIMSDLKMPVLDGFELLQAIRQDEALKCIPFVVLTASNFHRDRAMATALGADLYLLKPSRFEQMHEIIQAITPLVARRGSKPVNH